MSGFFCIIDQVLKNPTPNLNLETEHQRGAVAGEREHQLPGELVAGCRGTFKVILWGAFITIDLREYFLAKNPAADKIQSEQLIL